MEMQKSFSYGCDYVFFFFPPHKEYGNLIHIMLGWSHHRHYNGEKNKTPKIVPLTRFSNQRVPARGRGVQSCL